MQDYLKNASEEEKEYLSKYQITSYERPSLAVDIALFSTMGEQLKIMLIQRGSFPYRGRWALPGGFCKPNEDVKDTALRELYDETHIENPYISIINSYGAPDRDPRGWIISNTFLALVDGSSCVPRASSNAWKSCWFDVKLNIINVEREESDTGVKVTGKYELVLSNSEENLSFSSTITEYKEYYPNRENINYEINNSELAFDHAKIILNALFVMRKEFALNKSLIFNLMPETFTMTELRKALEAVLDKSIIKANFNRDMAGYVTETGMFESNVAYRPAKIYKRNFSTLYI